jgi:hypothetical protein
VLLIEVIPISLLGIEIRRNNAAGVPDIAMDGLLETLAQVVRLVREKSLRRSPQGARVSAKERQILLWHRDGYGRHQGIVTHGPLGAKPPRGVSPFGLISAAANALIKDLGSVDRNL